MNGTNQIGPEKERQYNEIAETLRQERALLWSLVDSIPDFIFFKDRDSVYLGCNKAYERHIGRSEKEIVGLTDLDLIPRADAEQYHEHDRQVLASGKPQRIVTWSERPDGRRILLDTLKTPYLGPDGETMGVICISRDITEHKRTEMALQESEERLRALVAALPDLILIYDGDGRYVQVIGRQDHLLYAEAAALEGRLVHDVLPPETADLVLHAIRQTIATGAAQMIEYELEVPAGSCWFEGRTSLITVADAGPQVALVARDITERKRAEQSVRQLLRAVEQSPVSVVITDIEGQIEYVNQKFAEVTGYTPKEAIGENPRILKAGNHPDDFYEELWHTITSGRDWHGELMNKKKNGELYWESASISPIVDEEGHITHFVAVKEDITERRLAEDALRQAREAAEAANRAKSAFLANMSHEIRTPMNAILGYAQLLRRDPELAPAQREHLDTILHNGDHLLALINGVLEMSEIGAGQAVFNPGAFDLHAMLSDLKSTLRLYAEATKLTLRVERDDNTPRYVVADRDKLRQVLINLLDNAVKFTERGGVTLRVWSRESECGARDKGEPAAVADPPPRADCCQLCFEVQDTGIGIAEDDLERLFRPFEWVGESTRIQGGTGLGLAISQAYVRLMDGKISVASQAGGGSVFRFEIPVEKSDVDGGRQEGKWRLGIEYLYSGDGLNELGTVSLERESLQGLPAEIVKQMREAAFSLDLERLNKLIGHVEGYDMQIATGLRDLVDRYEFGVLSDLLESGGRDAS